MEEIKPKAIFDAGDIQKVIDNFARSDVADGEVSVTIDEVDCNLFTIHTPRKNSYLRNHIHFNTNNIERVTFDENSIQIFTSFGKFNINRHGRIRFYLRC
jgi:hypothetical protein